MDYVKETLQRQSAVWIALFGGSEEIEEAEQEKVIRESREAESWEGGLRERNDSAKERLQRFGRERDESELLNELRITLSETTAEREEKTRLEREQLIRSRERLLSELSLRALREKTEERRDAAGKPVQESLLEAETARWEAEAAHREGRAGLETADARAISRRFERDARRYDGGFVFY